MGSSRSATVQSVSPVTLLGDPAQWEPEARQMGCAVAERHSDAALWSGEALSAMVMYGRPCQVVLESYPAAASQRMRCKSGRDNQS